MAVKYHPGALAVQARAGVGEATRRVGKGIRETLPPGFVAFLAEQPLAIVASAGSDGRLWASALTGPPGFLRALDERTLLVVAQAPPGDPLAANLVEGAALGLLAIDLATRRRVRVNGALRGWAEGGFVLETAEVFGNCQQYIQRRIPAGVAPPSGATVPRRSAALTAGQRRLVASADTFFIASAHPAGGADASHRGGPPGFVRVLDERTLVFPDYAGNTMFNTLGNIVANPSAGLLFVDFEAGTTLQLTGRAEVVWDAERATEFPGAERVVTFQTDETVEIAGAHPLRSRLVGYSPFNPA
jgi:predicted pyridoxine 5'-phosphate oxidase superfamily flavin-nucleotide-binding protein